MDSTSNLILTGALVIIMFGMGLSLLVSDFTRIFKAPKAILIGLTNQIVLLPLIAFSLTQIIPMPIEIAIGLIILSACPGGSTSNLISHLAKADVALSVSLTAVSSFLAIITIPLIINLGFQALTDAGQEIQIDTVDTISKVAIVLIFPIALGMILRVKLPSFAQKMERPVKIASASLLFIIILGLLVKERSNLSTWFAAAGVSTIALNILTMSVGYYSAKLLSISKRQSLSIAIESGIQNGTLAIAVAVTLIGNAEYAVTPAIYSLFMFLSGGFIIFLATRKQA